MARQDPAELTRQAKHALRAGQGREAERLLRQAIGLAPAHAQALLLLGQLQRETGRLDEALGHLERAVRSAPNDAEAVFTLANTQHQRPRLHAQARAGYERALELAPDSVAAHAALAKLCEETNELEAARASADRALALKPDEPAALLISALIDRREGKLGAARATFDRLVAGGESAPAMRLAPITRSTVWMRYGDVLDRLGEHAGAYDAFTRAQTERWSCGDAGRVNPQQPLQLIASAKAVMTPERLGEWAAFEPGDGLADPAFIVGFPRSGTTLTEQILAAHPGIVTLDEDTPLSDLMGPVAALSPAGPYLNGVPHLGEAKARELRVAYWKGAEQRLGGPLGERLLVDKLPLTIMHLPLVCRLFPRARVVVALRDPRDICVSCLMQVMTPNNAMWHLRSIPTTARFYAAVMGYWLEVRPRMAAPWMEWKYEDLIADPEGRARALLEFLGAPWDPGVMAFHERSQGKAISTPSYEAVARPINDKAVGRWRHYAERFEGTFETLAPLMEQFGYAQEVVR